MRRRAMKLMVLLIALSAGAIINVAVAWWHHLHGDVLAAQRLTREATRDEVSWWQRNAPPGFAAVPSGYSRVWLSTRDLIIISEHPYNEPPIPIGDHVDIGRCGWPFLSMEAIIWNERPSRKQTMRGFWQVPTAYRSVYRKYLPRHGDWFPTRPVWIGFIANTMVYGAIVWLAIACLSRVWFWHRSKRLQRRGLCPACGYDLRGKPEGDDSHRSVCPECGAMQWPRQSHEGGNPEGS